MREALKSALVLIAFLLLPSIAFAQATITGTVKDSSGAVLPGVRVEAASPALIERSRSAVTDGTGQYRIIDLSAGTYTLTFTLNGFSTVKREDIELAGSVARREHRRLSAQHRDHPRASSDQLLGCQRLVRTRPGISVPFWASRRPPGEARGERIPGVCKRRATKPGGMHRRPEWCSYSRTGP
jgi:hypothetical protein